MVDPPMALIYLKSIRSRKKIIYYQKACELTTYTTCLYTTKEFNYFIS